MILTKLKSLLDSDTTSYRIEKETGVPQPNVDSFRKGKSKLENATLETAVKLMELAKFQEVIENDMINIDDIKRLLESEMTSYKIAKDSGVSTNTIANYRTGVTDLKNMRLGVAKKVQNFLFSY